MPVHTVPIMLGILPIVVVPNLVVVLLLEMPTSLPSITAYIDGSQPASNTTNICNAANIGISEPAPNIVCTDTS